MDCGDSDAAPATPSALDRLRLAALCGLFVTIPLEVVLVLPVSFRIPPYIYLLPVVAVVALITAAGRDPWRQLIAISAELPRRLAQALALWVGVVTLSIGMWLVDAPPRVALAAEYGSVRASGLRAPIQLAILLSALAALPLVLALARNRPEFAVGAFLAVSTAVAAYGIYQVFAHRFDLPFYNISNDPLTAGRRVPSGGELGVRARSTFGEPAALGHYLLGGWAVAAGLVVWPPSRRVRVLALVSVAITTAALVAASSVGAVLGCLTIALAFFLAIAHRRAWLSGALLTVSSFGVAIAFVALLLNVMAPETQTQREPIAVERSDETNPSSGKDRAPSPTSRPDPSNGLVDDVTEAAARLGHRFVDRFTQAQSEKRSEIVAYQLELFSKRPALGVGLGATDLYLAADVAPGSLPGTHGVWWGSLSETGLAGTAALLAVLFVFGAVVLRAASAFPDAPLYGVQIGALAGVLAQMVGYLTFSERIAPHVWATMAIGVIACASKSRSVSPLRASNVRPSDADEPAERTRQRPLSARFQRWRRA